MMRGKLPNSLCGKTECQFCDITAVDCPDRVDEASQPEVGITNDF